MKRTTLSALSLALAAGLGMTTTSFADVYDTHPQGEVNFKVTNLSHDKVRIGCSPYTCAGKKFGPHVANLTVHEDTINYSKRLGYDDTKRYVVRYDLGKNDIPAKNWGAKIILRKFVGVDKHHHRIYHRCTVAVKAGPGQAMYKTYGKLCHHVAVKATLHSGTTAYAVVKYN